jgi:peroxiredoxin
MKTRLLTLVMICLLGAGAVVLAQAPGAKGEKKAPAPKTPADLALDAFNKVRGEAGPKDQARFAKVIAAGMAYLTEFPTHGSAAGAINNLAFYASSFDKKQPALKTAYVSLLKFEVTNAKYKDGVTDNAKAALAAVDAAAADFEVREVFNAANLSALREKIDALAEIPGGGRFLAERERSYLNVMTYAGGAANAEKHATKLLEHKEKAVKDMGREELNLLEVKKAPYDLKFTALDGKPVDFAQLRGKVVALYFWSSTNKASTDRFDSQQNSLKQIYSDYRKKGFEVVTVSYDKEEDREKLTKFIKDNKIPWPVYFDGKQAKNSFSPKLNVYSVPRLYVFDQKGILQTPFQGTPVGRLQPDLPMNQLENLLKHLLTPAKK